MKRKVIPGAVVALLLVGAFMHFTKVPSFPELLVAHSDGRIAGAGGVDVNMLISTYPGLIEADFDRVATLGGSYEMRMGALAHVAGAAERPESVMMISREGFDQLYANLASRFGLDPQDPESRVSIVRAIQ